MMDPERPLTDIPFEVPERMFREPPKPFEDAYARRCFRLLRMASILHMKGFQGLRVYPWEYPLAYRIELYPSTFTSADGVSYDWELSADWMEERRLIARHSGASGANYFDWEDVAGASAHDLAEKFIERFPAIAKATYHLDYEYAGWFSTLLAHCEYGYLPFLHAEYEPRIGAMRLRRVGGVDAFPSTETFPLPPSRSAGVELMPRPRPAWMSE
jgi:hypothetical protein